MYDNKRYPILIPASHVIVAWLALALGCAAQTTYYVDKATGNDAHDGLSTLAAWKTIQKAFDSATPGSTVLIRTGPYVEHPLLHVSGTPGQPIIFKNYPGESAVIDGDSTLGNTIVTMEDQHDVVLRNLRIQNMYTPDATGLLIRATPSGGVSNITITRCSVRWLGFIDDPFVTPAPNDNARPIVVHGEGLTPANAVTGLRLDSLNVYENITGYSDAISIDGNVDGFVVNECEVHDNTNIGIHAAGGHGVCAEPLWDNARGVIVRNRCWSNKSPYATSAGIYLDGADLTLVDRNKCWDNGYGIEIGCEQDGITDACSVFDNFLFSNREAGLAVGGYDTLTTGQVLNGMFRNNTLIKNDLDGTGSGEVHMTRASNCDFRNNLFYASSQGILFSREDIAPQSGNSFDFNAWYADAVPALDVEVNWGGSALVGFSDYVTLSGWDNSSFYADPMITDDSSIEPDAHLQDTSPCVDAGDPTTMILLTELDFDGSQRIVNDTIDIGAYEWQGPASIAEDRSRALLISPNPSNDMVVINAPFRIANIELRDTQGRSVIERTGDLGHLSLAGLADGVYPLLVVGENGERLLARVAKH